MRISIRTARVSLAAGLMWSGSGFAAGAATYLFHLSCTDRVFVAQWDTGLLDPGREKYTPKTFGAISALPRQRL